MIKQVVFVVCIIILVFCAMNVLGYMGDGFTSITTKVTGITSQFGDLIGNIQGFTNMSSAANPDDAMKTLEDIQSLGGIGADGSALGNLVSGMFGIKI